MITLFDKLFGDQILINRVLQAENIDIRHNMSLIELKGEKELESIVFKNTQTGEISEFETNNCFIAIGQVPQNEPFKDLIELDHGFIVTNDKMETSVPGIFAAGDTRAKDSRQVITACNDGAIAALEAVKVVSAK